MLQNKVHLHRLGLPPAVWGVEQLCCTAVSTFVTESSFPGYVTYLGNHICNNAHECMQFCSTGVGTLNELKSRWVAAGRPELPDWEALFDGL